MKRFLKELGMKQEHHVMHSDSHLSKNSSFHFKSKHIDVMYHWIRDVIDLKLLKLEKIHTDNNDVDM